MMYNFSLFIWHGHGFQVWFMKYLFKKDLKGFKKYAKI